MPKKLGLFFKKIIKLMQEPKMSILPGQMAFFIILSLIPIISLLGIIASTFAISIESLADFISDSFPTQVSNIIIPIISGKGPDINLIFFLLMAFFLASNATHSVIVTASEIYGAKQDNYLKTRIKAIWLIVIIITLIIFMLLVPAFGNQILNFLGTISFIKPIFPTLSLIFHVFKWPVTLFVVFVNIKLIYTVAPNINIKSRTVNYGALFTTLTWIIVTKIFSYYVTNLASYDIFYGSLSNIIILMLWTYIISYVFVLGIALNVTNQNAENKLKK